MTDPAQALLELARTELHLAAEGRVDELAELHDRRDGLMASLPAVPQPHQAQLLRQALAVQADVADLLTRTRDAVAAELQRLDQGRATLRAYAPAGAQSGRTFDSSG